MKSIATFFLLSFLSFQLLGQVAFNYEFTTTENLYTPLSEATAVELDENPWDDPDAIIPIGFEFTALDNTTSALYMNSDFVGGALTLSSNDAEKTTVFGPYFSDIADRGYGTEQALSPIVYQTEGNVGSRIFKMEWQNVAFYNEIADETKTQNFLNFQLWLYEGSNNIEYHYGPNQVDGLSLYDLHDGFSGPLIGFITGYNVEMETSDSVIYLANSPDQPELEIQALTEEFEFTDILTDSPANGTIYHFETGIVNTEELSQLEGAKVYPLPATDVVFVELPTTYESYELNFYNNLGQQVLQNKTVQAGKNELPISNLPKGHYWLTISAGTQTYSQAIVVQ